MLDLLAQPSRPERLLAQTKHSASLRQTGRESFRGVLRARRPFR